MPQVQLIDHTGKGYDDPWYAASLMIWTKLTRTELSLSNLEKIRNWPEERLVHELNYMAATVPSSWEFCDFTFLISGVTRAFTHQLVRTRNASYAQQAQQIARFTNGFPYHTGTTILEVDGAKAIYDQCMETIALANEQLVNMGVHTEDARGVLPTNIETNIVAKFNLRALADMLRKRASPRNQGARPGAEGEWTVVRREMRGRVYDVLPWTKIFLERTEDVVAQEMYELLEQVENKQLRVDLTKRVDQLLTNVGSGPLDGADA